MVDMVKKGDLPKVSERLQQRDKKERTGSLTGGCADTCKLVGGEGQSEQSDLLGFTKQLMFTEHLLCARRSILGPSQ